MVECDKLVAYLDDLLQVKEFGDYCPNGLQVEGRPEVNKLVTGVTASQALLDASVDAGADAVLVHHGYFWRGEDAVITGMKKRRLKTLLENDLSLFAYHLPLDAHVEYGNNIQLAKKLGFRVDGVVEDGSAKGLLWYGRLQTEVSVESFCRHLASELGRAPLHLPSVSGRKIRTIGWCTGAAQGYIGQAAELGLDAYLSGEVSEQTYHQAMELDIHYFSAGHHATETYGVQALGAHLAQKFSLQHQHIDLANIV